MARFMLWPIRRSSCAVYIPPVLHQRRARAKLFLTTLYVLAVSALGPTAGRVPVGLAAGLPAVAYPLKPSANGRYLVEQNNTPFLMVGDSIGNLSLAEATSYMDNRALCGINTLWMNLLSNGGGPPSTPTAPRTTALRPSRQPAIRRRRTRLTSGGLTPSSTWRPPDTCSSSSIRSRRSAGRRCCARTASRQGNTAGS